jgi:hypothetical protein
MKTVTTTSLTDHPLEAVFDIEPNTTVQLTEKVEPSEVVLSDLYDDKDYDIESQFQEIYDSAMTSFADQAGLLLQSDPKYSARNMEVANAFLNTALSAAKERASLKLGKDKLAQSGGPKTVNNNLIMDRNDMLKMLKDATK